MADGDDGRATNSPLSSWTEQAADAMMFPSAADTLLRPKPRDPTGKDLASHLRKFPTLG